MGFLIMDAEDWNFIWQSICDLQLIFHPRYSREGKLDSKNLSAIKNKKKIFLVLDRNLLSSLLKLSRDGYLKNKNEMHIIGLLMTWIFMNGFLISPGLALKEHATNINSSIEPKLELQELNNIFDYYPSMMWLHLSKGMIDKIPVSPLDIKPFITKTEYDIEDDHLLMHTAEMLYVVYLYKRHNLSPAEKMIDFLKWNYKYLLVCESTLAYVAMLFTNQSGIKPPKNSGSNDIQKILKGCQNQAWDLNYLSIWSCFHYHEENMNKLFMFATNDALLKMIFINAYAKGGVTTLLRTIFSKSDIQKIYDVINANQGSKRIKPDFGRNPKEYFRKLIDQEKHRIEKTIDYQR